MSISLLWNRGAAAKEGIPQHGGGESAGIEAI
jgi:hypothetical protein